MTRHRTYLPRTASAKCAVCEARVGAGCGRTRCDIIGQVMCSKHGQASRRYTNARLLDIHPDLFVLLRARADLTFLRSKMLDPELLTRLVRYLPKGGTRTLTLPFLMPFHRDGARDRHRCRRNGAKISMSCGDCGAQLDSEGRRESRPWGGVDYCRPCHARMARQHERAATQFTAIVTFVRRNQGCWLLGLLHPMLRGRVVRHLATLRAPRALDPDRFV